MESRSGAVSPAGSEVFRFAEVPGLPLPPATGEWLRSFAIVTTPNELTAEVRDRMPVIPPSRNYDRWLERGHVEQPPIYLLRPYEAEAMHAEKAHPKVGNVRNNGWRCCRNRTMKESR